MARTPVTGSIDADARYDDTHKQVYVGTDDGFVYAVEPKEGKMRWSYKARGAVERRPELGGDSVFFSTAGDRVLALEPRTGKALWQYEREPPEGFTIHGHGGPRLARGVVYAGFSDGVLVALNARHRRRDVVALAGGCLRAVRGRRRHPGADRGRSGAGRVLLRRAVRAAASNGDLKWRLNVEGASGVQVIGKRLFFAAPRDGLTALTDTGEVLWRQGLADAGDLPRPSRSAHRWSSPAAGPASSSSIGPPAAWSSSSTRAAACAPAPRWARTARPSRARQQRHALRAPPQPLSAARRAGRGRGRL